MVLVSYSHPMDKKCCGEHNDYPKSKYAGENPQNSLGRGHLVSQNFTSQGFQVCVYEFVHVLKLHIGVCRQVFLGVVDVDRIGSPDSGQDLTVFVAAGKRIPRDLLMFHPMHIEVTITNTQIGGELGREPDFDFLCHVLKYNDRVGLWIQRGQW